MFAASLYGLGADLVRRKFQFTEFVERSWFLVSVALLPAILVSIPLGVAIALQVGALAAQIGATSFVGAADAIGVLREASPIVTALLLAGVGGSAVCAELGARTIREEIDAMTVLGLNPLRRLVAPLMVAGVLVARVPELRRHLRQHRQRVHLRSRRSARDEGQLLRLVHPVRHDVPTSSPPRSRRPSSASSR